MKDQNIINLINTEGTKNNNSSYSINKLNLMQKYEIISTTSCKYIDIFLYIHLLKAFKNT